MIIDSSVIVAVLMVEAEATAFVQAMRNAPVRAMSAATLLETSIVMLRRTDHLAVHSDIDGLIERAGIEIEPVTLLDARRARDAFASFGRGRHKAALNFGDCFTYALARRLNRPIFCKGFDFIHTDVPVVEIYT
jgi:ribonuclease VapC